MNRVLILLLLTGFVFADQDAASNTTADGLVPFCASWDITTSSDNVGKLRERCRNGKKKTIQLVERR